MKILYFLRLGINLKYVILLFLGGALCFYNCTIGSAKSYAETEQRKDNISSIEHYWDTYDFADTIRLNNPEETEKMLVDYLIRLSKQTEERACESIRELVVKTKVNVMVNHWFLQQLEHHLYEPDSPLRNDNYYISVLKEALASGDLNGMMRVRPLYQLEMLQKNRVGAKAADITFTLPTGRIGSLWDVSAKYTLLLFYNPDCMHCQKYIQELSDSPVINAFLQHSEDSLSWLTLVVVCVEGDIDVWKEYQMQFPSTWVSGYGVNKVVIEKDVYFLRSFPSLYLLGEDKQVLLKEPSSMSQITNYLLNEYDTI
ncbi:DUF5106 domain-containing protein [uncultured Bacteroides sp.]|uniref:DUF5106 domain-containing protein n=1 Tax=uncultured Bacteroides sp. TaxID=162156 RepID=UPI0025CBD656|nr:DUF5106 domain-containing protein [uncultured Bacteroides sp.]